jgi:cysteine-rich repeat protein
MGFNYSGSPITCSRTTSGDRKVEGAERYDDGNAVSFDECSADYENKSKYWS